MYNRWNVRSHFQYIVYLTNFQLNVTYLARLRLFQFYFLLPFLCFIWNLFSHILNSTWKRERVRVCTQDASSIVYFTFFHLSNATSEWTMPNSDWSIESYHNPFEPDEQWELKKKFMEEYRHMFDEDRLVCLAQVLVNVEILGCR